MGLIKVVENKFDEAAEIILSEKFDRFQPRVHFLCSILYLLNNNLK
jgi:hypothetical protein